MPSDQRFTPQPETQAVRQMASRARGSGWSLVGQVPLEVAWEGHWVFFDPTFHSSPSSSLPPPLVDTSASSNEDTPTASSIYTPSDNLFPTPLSAAPTLHPIDQDIIRVTRFTALSRDLIVTDSIRVGGRSTVTYRADSWCRETYDWLEPSLVPGYVRIRDVHVNVHLPEELAAESCIASVYLLQPNSSKDLMVYRRIAKFESVVEGRIMKNVDLSPSNGLKHELKAWQAVLMIAVRPAQMPFIECYSHAFSIAGKSSRNKDWRIESKRT